ncbi:DUF2971 domain-containing protein [Mesorhizobium sp. ES1-3]|uniref:DUF2971 domain-containing protein n=1 Tax=Mesorhizobium sp. ES1-3 TaxID=2876628 RepID=UPI001CCA936A|nr:DUF2971 domain-containing protein [Mesorhizobium sp. ES1-3]MBZ9673798.1 DUF2971 domain-containing protein [Mesorhizobium sp. ES1-3]
MHTEYRSEWVAAGYDRHMGSAEVVQPPGSDFVRAYYLTSAEYAISNIALGRIKVSRFSDLNDPFELLALRGNERDVRDFSRLLRKEYDKSTGLLCFSKNWISPPLWSHYASRHRGICLGFDISRAALADVVYAEERVTPYKSWPPSDMISEDLRSKLAKTKFQQWAYEAETRLIFPLESAVQEGGLFFKAFGPDLSLAEVILGPLCDIPLAGIRSLVSAVQPNAVAFRSRLAWHSFSVVPMESTVNW